MNRAYIGVALALFLVLVVVVIVVVKLRPQAALTDLTDLTDPTKRRVVAAVDQVVDAIKNRKLNYCPLVVKAYDTLWPLDRKSELFQTQMARMKNAYSEFSSGETFPFPLNKWYKNLCN